MTAALSPAVRRRRTITALLLVGLLFLLVRGGRAMYDSPAFRLKEVVVEGNSARRLSDAQIVEAAEVPVGTPLLGLSAVAVARRVESHPWVARARVERLVPSKLRITVVERRPEFLVTTPGGPFLVDAEGLVLQQGSEELVNLVDLPLPAVERGERLSSREFRNAADIYRSLPTALRTSVSSISAPTVDQTMVRLFGGPAVHYGMAEQLEDKNFALQRLLPDAGAGSVIDVRVPSRPSIRNA